MGLFDFFKGKAKPSKDESYITGDRRDAACLTNAAYNDDSIGVRRMLQDSTDMFYAAYSGDVYTVKRLLADGANPNMRVHGYPAIYYPVLNSDNTVCFALLDAGADPNIEYPGGLFPLYAAAEVGNIELVKKLLSCGAEIDKLTPKGCTALRNAVEEGHYPTAEFLIVKGANVNSVNKAGYTILDAAEREGQYRIAQLLKRYGAVGNLSGLPGMEELAQLLNQNGDEAPAFIPDYPSSRATANQPTRSDVQAAYARWETFKIDTRYRSSLLTMGIVENRPNLVEQGLNEGESPNRRYSYEEDNDSITTPNRVKIITPIVQATVNGSLEIVRLLIEHGADPNLAQKNGEYALLDAANRGYVEIAEYLLDHGADPNLDTGIGTALAFADNAAIMRILLEHGADPNIPDGDGDLPIIGSIDTRRMDEIELLIAYGTDMNHKNKRGVTPLERAKMRGISKEVAQIVARYPY